MTKPWRTLLLVAAMLLGGCAAVGPDYERPESPLGPDWYQAEFERYDTTAEQQVNWWQILGDPALDRLVERAYQQNNSLKIAGLRVLEARAQLGIAQGNRFPQSQVVTGQAVALGASENAANTAAGDLSYTQYSLGVGASWEIDFWGKFRRGIEAADASYLASIAAYEQVMVLVTAQVSATYLAIRTLEEKLRITEQNIALQQRSFDIVNVQYENGSTSELDVLQARTLLMSTRSTVPALQTELYKSKHALSTLLGLPPGDLGELLKGKSIIPQVPEKLQVGLPADLLRRRPDVRRAEYQAMAQNAIVGVAESNLYPSFSLAGSIGLVAAGNTDTTRSGESGIGQLFNADSLTYSIGPAFVWPFLNYDRLKNNVLVQDARLQQALLAYRDTVLNAAREVEDALVSLDGAARQEKLLAVTVESARRSTEVAQLRFNEGFADYQRVLDAQQALFSQQSRYVTSLSNIVGGFISLYVALGGGWQDRADFESAPDETSE